jgi:hypothetical protein
LTRMMTISLFSWNTRLSSLRATSRTWRCIMMSLLAATSSEFIGSVRHIR